MNGYFVSRYGYRWVLIIAMGFLNAFIVVVFFANSTSVLLVGQILCGLSWGVFATLAPSYGTASLASSGAGVGEAADTEGLAASEVCPTNLRGYLTTYVNLCWAIGQLIAAGVLNGCLGIEGEMGYRIPFAIQWVSVAPSAPGRPRAPPSDWTPSCGRCPSWSWPSSRPRARGSSCGTTG